MAEKIKSTKNKGEWSEAYVLTFLAQSKKIVCCDRNLNRLGSVDGYSIKSFILNSSENKTKSIELTIHPDSIEVKDGNRSSIIPDEDLKQTSKIILERIQKAEATFEIPELKSFWERLFNPTLKARSGVKRDLTIGVYDERTSSISYRGFSVKSDLGARPSLVNASGATNFLFQVPQDFSVRADVVEAKDLGRAVKDTQVQILGPVNEKYKQNLAALDARLADLISYVLLEYYGGKSSQLKEVVKAVFHKDPLNLKSEDAYKKIIVKFLEASALGMTPNKIWNSVIDADGGMIVVKKNSEIVCFYRGDDDSHNEFLEYLYENTIFETPSKTRHKFGSLGSDKKFKLNLQIRTKD
jgi:hypothetical protein